MDRRKTLSKNDEAGASSLRRQSIVSKQQLELSENDDEAERAALHRESAPLPSVAGGQTPNRRSLSFETVSGMSAPQISEGIAACIKLGTQNKINTKNAFSLNLIDYMSYTVRNNNDLIPNLQLAGTTLDFSTKIYSYRVDSLHLEILKISGTFDDNKNKSADNSMSEVAEGDNDENNQPNKSVKKPKKRKRALKIITTIESLTGTAKAKAPLAPPTLGDSDCQTTDMLHQSTLPQHCGTGLSLHLYNDTILDTDNGNNVETNDIPWPESLKNVDFNKEVCDEIVNFDFIEWSTEDDINLSQQISQRFDTSDLEFDMDTSLPHDDAVGHPQPDVNVTGVREFTIHDNDDDQRPFFAEVENNVPDNSSINKVMKNITNKDLEYSYFQDAIDIRWFGSTHWKINAHVQNLGGSRIAETCRQNVNKKNKVVDIECTDELIEECKEQCLRASSRKNNKKIQLNVKTAKVNWSEEKLILPCKFQESKLQKLCNYFLKPKSNIDLKKLNPGNATVLSDDATDYNYNNLNDTTNYFKLNDGNVDDYHDGDADGGEIYDENNAIANGHDDNIEAVPQSGLISDNLVELAKPTQKLFIQFSQRAKKLNMRSLKRAIWNNLIENESEKENIEKSPNNKSESVKESKDFSQIYKTLPSKLNNQDAEDLSFPLAFVSLLHLANEKSLKISSADNYSKISISQD